MGNTGARLFFFFFVLNNCSKRVHYLSKISDNPFNNIGGGNLVLIMTSQSFSSRAPPLVSVYTKIFINITSMYLTTCPLTPVEEYNVKKKYFVMLQNQRLVKT